MEKIKKKYSYIALGGEQNINKDLIVYRPAAVRMVPTKDDYYMGHYNRYFFKKKNENDVRETSFDEYEKVEETLYSKFSCKWYISGSINFAKKENSASASRMLDKFGTNSILNDPLEFFRR